MPIDTASILADTYMQGIMQKNKNASNSSGSKAGLRPAVTDDIGALIQRKIQERQQQQNAPLTQPIQATSSIGSIQGGDDASRFMSSMTTLGQGIFGNEDRAAKQQILDAQQVKDNRTEQRLIDADILNAVGKGQQLKESQQRMETTSNATRKADEAEQINLATQRNTATAKMNLIDQIKGLRTTKNTLADMVSKGEEQGLLTAGGAGQDFILTDKGKSKEYTDFAEKFNSRADIEDMTKKIQNKYDQDILKRAADKNRLNDTTGLSAQEISQVFLAPSAQSVKAAADINASQQAGLEREIKKLTGNESGYKNNVFSSSQFDLNESLDQPATDVLSQITNNAEDAGEVRRLQNRITETHPSAKLLDDPAQLKFVLGKVLTDVKDVETFWEAGQWDDEKVEETFKKYVTEFLSAKKVGEDINKLKKTHQTKTALRNLNLTLSGG